MSEAALLPSASWIWFEHAYVDPVNRYGQFRREVTLDARTDALPTSAPAWVSADQAYQLFVNGRYVCRGPARGYHARWPVDEVDLAPFLRPGVNIISAVVHAPGVSTFQYISALSAGWLFAAQIGGQRVVTDASWRCRPDPSRVRHTPKLTKQMGFQEQVDLRQDDRAWLTAASDSLDATWATPGFVAPYGSAPWHDTEPRGVPMLTRNEMPYANAVGAAHWACFPKPASSGPARPTAEHFDALRQAGWSPSPDARVEAERLRFAVPAVEAGQARAITLDLGRASVGELLLEVQGAVGGETLDVLFAEACEGSGRPVLAEPARSDPVDIATRLTLAPDSCVHRAFQVVGHRCATLVVLGPAPALELAVGHRETRYPLAVEGSFDTDHAGLMSIYRASIHTQRNCMLDAYVDTPWREQAQWWGDARVQAWNTFYLADDARLLQRGLRQIGDDAQALPNGLTYGHAPTIAHTCVLPDFTCVWMLTVWDHYFQTGSTAMLEELGSRIDRALGYFEHYGVASGELVPADPRYWLFLDWTEGLPRTGRPALLNLLLLEALQRLGELIDASDYRGPLERARTLADVLKKTIDTQLWDARRQRYRDGIDESGRPFETCSLHAQVQAVRCGLRPDWHTIVARDVVTPFLQGKSDESAEPTPYWLTYVYEAARRLGVGREVLPHLAKHWAPMAESGGTWERFDPPGTGETSGSHAWSAHPIHHLPRLLAGVVNTAPGWSRIHFEPVLDWPRTNRAEAAVPTPHGPIRARWNRGANDDPIKVALDLPAGITAQVVLPGCDPATLKGSNQWTWNVPASAVDEPAKP
ncbi:MAG: alpha-L-rhamnosidase C-terminal domain-containing protein [Planctomycetota bacterium]